MFNSWKSLATFAVTVGSAVGVLALASAGYIEPDKGDQVLAFIFGGGLGLGAGTALASRG